MISSATSAATRVVVAQAERARRYLESVPQPDRAGLRKPSAEILQGIARGLRISAETLYVRAGILDERGDPPDLVAAVSSDPSLTERQKQVLVEIYRSFQQDDREDAAG